MPNINEKKTRRLYINAKYHDYHCKISMQMSISTFTQTPFSQNAIQLQTTLNITFDENVLNSMKARFNKIQQNPRQTKQLQKIQQTTPNSTRFNKTVLTKTTPKQAKLRTKTRFNKQAPTQNPTNASKIARITPSPIHINALLLYFSRNAIALHIDLWEQHAFSL